MSGCGAPDSEAAAPPPSFQRPAASSAGHQLPECGRVSPDLCRSAESALAPPPLPVSAAPAAASPPEGVREPSHGVLLPRVTVAGVSCHLVVLLLGFPHTFHPVLLTPPQPRRHTAKLRLQLGQTTQLRRTERGSTGSAAGSS